MSAALPVMAGLVPAIHVGTRAKASGLSRELRVIAALEFCKFVARPDVDARDKLGHDEERGVQIKSA